MSRGRMTADLLGGPTIEIGDRDGEHVATMTIDEATELYRALGNVLHLSPTNIATGNAIVGQQIGHVSTVIDGHDDPRNWRQRGEDGRY